MANLKTQLESWESQDSGTFWDLQYCTFQWSTIACKVKQLFFIQTLTYTVWPKKGRHFVCRFRALRSGISRIWKKVSESWDPQELGSFFRFARFRFDKITLDWHAEGRQFFWLGDVICVGRKGRAGRGVGGIWSSSRTECTRSSQNWIVLSHFSIEKLPKQHFLMKML